MDNNAIYLIMQADRDKVNEARRILSRRNKHINWDDIIYLANASPVFADKCKTDAISDCRKSNRKGHDYLNFYIPTKLY